MDILRRCFFKTHLPIDPVVTEPPIGRGSHTTMNGRLGHLFQERERIADPDINHLAAPPKNPATKRATNRLETYGYIRPQDSGLAGGA